MYSFEPIRVTKALLRDQRSEEEYMSFYLGIVPDKNLHKNPLRPDRNPTASFYRAANGELIFKDFKTGFHGNFLAIVMEKFKVTYVQALKIVANDFGIISKPNYTKNEAAIVYDGTVVTHKQQTTIQIEAKEFSETELDWWLQFGITGKILDKFHVFSAKSLFLNGNYHTSSTETSPIYGYYFGKEEGRELWKIYYPLRETFRFLLNTNKLQGVKQLPKTGEVVVVTKSLKDVMTLYAMGIPAVAPQAESVIISQKQYDALAERFSRVIINGDWDGAGQRFMQESRKRYSCIALSFSDKKTYAKDISDLTKKYGFDKTSKLVANILKAVKAGKYDYQLDRWKYEKDFVS